MIMSNADHLEHLSYCIRNYPECLDSLHRVCAAWKRYGRLPARIGLGSNTSSIEPSLLKLFGPGALQLSKNGAVTLVTGRLFPFGANEDSVRWVRAVHEVCAIPFVENKLIESKEEERELALRKWNLMFPELSELAREIPLSRNGCASGADQLDLWIQTGRIVTFLMRNTEALTVSDLGARFCGDSKTLRGGELIALIADWLVFLDMGIRMYKAGMSAEFRKSLRKQALECHGVVENRFSVAVTVFGPLVFEKNGKRMEHVMERWKDGEPALLSLGNLDNITAVELPAGCRIYTCENESPFTKLVRDRHEGVLIYTRGFPNGAVCKLYKLITARYPDGERFHWGDTDLAGLRIASIINGIAPLCLWRCDLDAVSGHRSYLIPIDENERSRIRRFLENNPEFPFRDVLEFTGNYGWLEQERVEDLNPALSHS